MYERSGTIHIEDALFTVTQDNYCTARLEPGRQVFENSGGTGNILVKADKKCKWSTDNIPDWITFTSSGEQSGVQTLSYTVSQNTHPFIRDARLDIAGKPFVVTQKPACTGDLSPLYSEMDASWGEATVQINLPPDCPWRVEPGADWISITSPDSGMGPGFFTYTV